MSRLWSMFRFRSFRIFYEKIVIFRTLDHWSEILSLSAGRPLSQGVCPSLVEGFTYVNTVTCAWSLSNIRIHLVLRHVANHSTSPGQISTKHLKTSIKPFFATCRLPRYPEFWRCYRPRHTFLGPHWKRSLKSLDNLLTVTTPNTQLLPRPRKMSLSS